MSQGNPLLLLVDDDPLTLKSLRLLFAKTGYDVMAAPDGRFAQSVIDEHGIEQFSCVLTDFRMPGLTGLELVEWIRSRDPSLSAILLTAEGDKDVIANALRGGVCDYIEKPYRFAQVREAVERAIKRTQANRAVAVTVSEVREITLLQNQFSYIRQHNVKSVLADAGGVEVITRLHPIKETGGDFVNSYPLGENKLCVLIGDISGHDLKAGFISAYFQGMVRGMLDMRADIAQICDNFNRHLIEDWNRHSNVEGQPVLKTSLACCALSFDFTQRTMTFHNHGIPPPLWVSAPVRTEPLGMGSPPLGWFPDLPNSGQTAPMNPEGGMCYVWSDGLEDYADQMGISPSTLSWKLAHTEDENQRAKTIANHADDISVACVRWGALREPNAPTLLFAEAYIGGTNDRIDIYEARWQKSLLWAMEHLPRERMDEISLCLREAVINGVLHGCNGNPKRRAHLSIFYCPTRERLMANVRDEGPGYPVPDFDREASPDASGHISYGLRIIRAYAKELAFRDSGRELYMEFALTSA